MATLTIRGDAVRAASPDEVLLRVTLSAVRSTPREAMDDVATRSNTLQSLLEDLGIDPSSRSTSEISLAERRDFEKGAYHHRGYEASTTVLIRLPADAESQGLVARLVGDAVGQTDAQVEGPWWRIRLENTAWSEARREAALDARKKAEDYAAALDIRLGPIVEIREPGTSRPPVHQHLKGVDAFAAEALPGPSPNLRVEAGDLDVHASVEVTFGLEPR